MSDYQPTRNRKFPIFRVVLVVLILAILVAGIFFTVKYFQLRANPNQVSQEQTKSLTDKVGKLIALPNNETPTIATVQDKTKLKDQPFFKDAQQGDKLLIYTNAKKAIIYREKDDKIINVGPIAINTGNDVTTSAEEAPKTDE